MIDSNQFVNCVWMAAMLIALGLVPGLFQNAMDAVSAFSAGVTALGLSRPAWPTPRPANPTQLCRFSARGMWPTALGILIFLVGLLAYTAR